MARRQNLTLTLALGLVLFVLLTYWMAGDAADDTRSDVASAAASIAKQQQQAALGGGEFDVSRMPAAPSGDEAVLALAAADARGGAQLGDMAAEIAGLPDGILTGGSIAPKLANATIKAELGRASWKLLHTMMARFPEKPTDDERLALKTFITLLSRLYPCGDCAEHFRKLLAKYPPQIGSRNAAAGWACFVHNEVNKRLRKELFDCSKIGDFYDCGCGDDKDKDKDMDKKAGAEAETGSKAETKTGTGSKADDSTAAGEKDLKGRTRLVLEEEDRGALVRGG